MNLYDLLRLLILRPTRLTEHERAAALELLTRLENTAALGSLTTTEKVEQKPQYVSPLRKDMIPVYDELGTFRGYAERIY